MNIELDKYYVTKGLNTVFAKEQLVDSQIRMISTDYIKPSRWFGVQKEGNYYLDKTESYRDIIETLEDKTTTHDLHIVDLFQLIDFTMNKLYTTTESKHENIKINYGFGSEFKIYHSSVDEAYRYPIVSTNSAMSVSNKIFKLHEALKGF